MRYITSIIVGAAALAAQPAAAQTQTYVTGFAKTSNIYANLNQQYPNSGPGVPGSRTGTPNATYLFTPLETGQGNPDNLNYTTPSTTISYQLASDALGRDFAEVGSADFGLSSLLLPIDVVDASAFYLLAGAYNGSSFNITFSGSGGYSRTFSNIALPDFSGGGTINTVGGGVSDQTVFRTFGTGAGGTGNSSNGAVGFYNLTEVGFDLSDLAGRTLNNATITGNGFETLILGATAVSPRTAVGAVPEPAAWTLMICGFGLVGGALRRRWRAVVPA